MAYTSIIRNYFAGRDDARAEEQASQANAFNALRLQQMQRQNALASNPNATPEDYIRGGDAQTGVALQSYQDRAQTDKQQAFQRAAAIAQRALTLPDEQSRKGFLQQVLPAYAQDFAALGANIQQGLPQMLALPDAELQQKLQQFAALAAPEKPIEVAAGASLATRAPGGGYQSVFTAPKDTSLTPYQQQQLDIERQRLEIDRNKTGAAGGGFNDPAIQDLQAAISASGYSLPAGFRSQAQQLSLLHGLLRKYKGLAPDDIAHLLGSNAIDYKSITKATQTAATVVGKVEVANNELQAFVPIARDASALVDRGNFVPWNQLKQKGEAAISDPNLKRLYVATQSILNAYDMLAARGGTDQAKREHNRAILSSADSPEAYEAALDMIVREGQAAGQAARASTKASAYQDHPATAAPAGATQEITASGPNGQKLVLRNGQWVPQ